MTKSEFLKASKEEQERYICTFVTQMVRSSEHDTKPDRDRWRVAEGLFKGRQTWGAERDKHAWMSKPFLHEFSAIVRRCAAAAQDFIFERPDFFSLEPSDDADRELGAIFEKIVRYYCNLLDFETATYDYLIIGGVYGLAVAKLSVEPRIEWAAESVIEALTEQEIKERKKIRKDIEGAEPALVDPAHAEGQILTAVSKIFGIAPTPLGRKLKPKRKFKLGFKLSFPNVFNVFFEPDCARINETPYWSERSYPKLYTLEPLFDLNVLDPDKREALRQSCLTFSGTTTGANVNSSYEGQKWNQREQFIDMNSHTPVCELIEWWGPLLDSAGRIIEENKHFVVGNGRVLLKNHQNPYFDQRPPYYAAVFSKSPFKAVGEGVADNAIPQQLLINDIMGLWIDFLRLLTYQPKTIDTSKLANTQQVEGYIEPGLLIDVMNAKPGEVIGDIPMNPHVAPYIFQTIEALRYSGEKGAGISTQSANPTSRTRISAAEVGSNVQRDNQSIFTLGRELDAHYLIPTVERLVDYCLQFGFEQDSLEDLLLAGVLTQSEYQLVANIPKVERFNEIKRNWRVKIKGFRARLERDEFLSKINEAISVLGAIPGALEHVNVKELLKQYFDAFNFDSERLLVQATPEDKAREENNLLRNSQQISIGPNDDDARELPIHYELAMREPSEAVLTHCMGHIQRAMATTGNFPPPPPEIAQMLGLEQQPPGAEPIH